MKKQLLLVAFFFGAVFNLLAAHDEATKDQLNKLASEMTTFLVSTPDATFESYSGLLYHPGTCRVIGIARKRDSIY